MTNHKCYVFRINDEFKNQFYRIAVDLGVLRNVMQFVEIEAKSRRPRLLFLRAVDKLRWRMTTANSFSSSLHSLMWINIAKCVSAWQFASSSSLGLNFHKTHTDPRRIRIFRSLSATERPENACRLFNMRHAKHMHSIKMNKWLYRR